MTNVCILDYGSGNVGSVFNLFVSIGVAVKVSNTAADVADASHIVLPGVGAFGASMRKIRERLPLEALERAVHQSGKPFLGICVGMQVLADRGTEFGEHEGLGWIGGSVDRLEAGDLPLPHIGWNNISPNIAHALFGGLGTDPDFYYVHSYAFNAIDPATVIATSDFGQNFAAAICKENLLGVQFHPEKSQHAGRRLVSNFVAMA